jgi:hypothetical protein
MHDLAILTDRDAVRWYLSTLTGWLEASALTCFMLCTAPLVGISSEGTQDNGRERTNRIQCRVGG